MTTTKRSRGRPSLYQLEFAEQARKLCGRGSADRDLAEWFGVSPAVIGQWRRVHDDFREACKLGKDAAIDELERSAFDKARGYRIEKEVVLSSHGQVFKETVTEEIPGDASLLRWILE